MKQYVIFGDNAFAQRIYQYISYEGIHKVLCFTNEERFISRNSIEDLNVVPFEQLSKRYDKSTFEILICIGYTKMNQLRNQIYTLCKDAGYNVGSWLSSRCLSYTNNIEEGNIIMPGVLIGPGSKLGICNIVESRVCISHDSTLGNFNFISSNVILGGYASIHNRTFIGLNATIKSGVSIATLSLIGAAANVITPTEAEGVYIGNPAKKVKNKKALSVKI